MTTRKITTDTILTKDLARCLPLILERSFHDPKPLQIRGEISGGFLSLKEAAYKAINRLSGAGDLESSRRLYPGCYLVSWPGR